MKKYNIKLINKNNNLETNFECAANEYILDAAEKNDIELPYSCRAGSCSTCLGKIINGKVDQSDQTFLENNQIEKGFVLLCIAYPSSNLIISTHEEENLY